MKKFLTQIEADVRPISQAITSHATPTFNTDQAKHLLVTALATNITNFSTNLSGTPAESDRLLISLTGTGVYTINWGSKFEGSLPTSVGTTRLDLVFLWNTVTSKWLIVGASVSSILNGLVITATTGTFTLASGKTLTVNNTITITGTDGVTYTMPEISAKIGFRGLPQNIQSGANYTCVLNDRGKHILHPSADTTARTFTIPANNSVAFEIGDTLTFVNQNGAGVVSIAITTDVMRLAGAGTTGTRSLAANGIATALKLTSTEWIISGNGLT